jgi:hypothetical protein
MVKISLNIMAKFKLNLVDKYHGKPRLNIMGNFNGST